MKVLYQKPAGNSLESRSSTAPTSKRSEGHRFWLSVRSPFQISCIVARVLGSKRSGPPRSVPRSALGSSDPAETMPRGR